MALGRRWWGWGWGALVVVCACTATVTTAAQAQTSWEFWPELSLYKNLSPITRMYLDVSYAKQRESDVGALDLQAYVDISLKPKRRRELQQRDWQRSRFLWVRIGYDHVADVGGGTHTATENRGILALYSKADLRAGIVLEARARADLRWLDGAYSTRYRVRLEATREFIVRNHSVVPYFNVEWFYDMRYDDWSRTLYQLGSEFTLSKHFRYELFLARQNDYQSVAASLNAGGVVAKWYY